MAGIFAESDLIGETYVKPIGQEWKKVGYAAIDGHAVFEGCILLGTVTEMKALVEEVRQNPGILTPGAQPLGAAILGQQFRWKGRRVPYQIDPVLQDQQRVVDAIAHWHANTPFQFVQREDDDDDYVNFRPGNYCLSMIGRRGGPQDVILGPSCSTGHCIHEIGHVAGLWHEQSRSDRDDFVEVMWDNLSQRQRINFDKHVLDAVNLGPYDYDSIMHYPRDAFSINQKDTIVPKKPHQCIGQRVGLSAGDIAAINKL